MSEPHPDAIYAAVTDLNGLLRGKRIRPEQLNKTMAGELAMPRSVVGIDIWGEDVLQSEQVFATGDGDAHVVPVIDQPIALPGDHTLILGRLQGADDEYFDGDPFCVLSQAIERLDALELKAMVACELEFYLQRDPRAPDTKKDLLSIDALIAKQGFFDELYLWCQRANIRADAVISESGHGQYEVNLQHQADPLAAAYEALIFKQITKALARSYGLSASFMAKPFGDQAGSGLHIHCSLLDRQNNNVFDDASASGSEALRHAIAGVLASLIPDQLLLAPHANSYRRLRPLSHAPTKIAWGYDNRTVALRVPGGDPSARRLEHRVAGADANPLLVMASLINAMVNGLESKAEAPAPIVGDGYQCECPEISPTWAQAISQFQAHNQGYNETFKTMYNALKQQEINVFLDKVNRFEFDSYWDSV